ncbi:hypothetical protein KP509_23G065600 [Ceratopteris richardii]|uniref:E3 UFM1-protein ligase-like C-terminal domain-containing protein n=1 Tax=Ceratopteris richardii TaxID=49495 RepID=A0A8T2S2L5_CERRI|nr:hypothetical protein KP509_23G065600 [Ceratopteris richardii]
MRGRERKGWREGLWEEWAGGCGGCGRVAAGVWAGQRRGWRGLRAALQAPGRTIASAINHLKKVIPENLYATLMEYHSITVALLSMLSTSVPGGPVCTSDRMLGQRERLAEMMPRLKEIVLNREYLTV